ncbi:hypothetical protein [Spongiactinospora sp. 9N601]|uniref:hypothetical protein n=1 Tax=Spongiactinospora sp. 9N601 TaxID=3375149 RepID=UPI00379C6330
MTKIQEQQRAYQLTLLGRLRDELVERGVIVVLAAGEEERPWLDVTDADDRVRKVFVHLAFLWFYWGDQADERVSCTDIGYAADRIREAALAGWHPGEQGELSFNLGNAARAYLS